MRFDQLKIGETFNRARWEREGRHHIFIKTIPMLAKGDNKHIYNSIQVNKYGGFQGTLFKFSNFEEVEVKDEKT